MQKSENSYWIYKRHFGGKIEVKVSNSSFNNVHIELQTKTNKGVPMNSPPKDNAQTIVQKLNMSSIETIETKQTSLGEAPHWCPIENVLYFLDILNAEIFRYDPVSNKCTSVKVD